MKEVHTFHLSETYQFFTASCDSEDLVAMSYSTSYRSNRTDQQSVRVHRLHGNRLQEIARVELESPYKLLWLTDLLLVDDFNNVIELEIVYGRLDSSPLAKSCVWPVCVK